MSRPTQISIDRSALLNNLNKVKTCAPLQKVMAVVKANAYGHGAVRIAQLAEPYIDAFAVCSLDEALVLKEKGIRKPLVLLEGFFYTDELALIAHHHFEMVVHSPIQVEQLLSTSLSSPINIWLKIDTGMHRLGFAPHEIKSLYQRLKVHPARVGKIRMMSHLSCADDMQDRTTLLQTQVFNETILLFGVETSLANSAGIMGWPQTHAHWVRPGIMLYGVSPFLHRTGQDEGLQPVMTLQSILISVKTHHFGDAIGYGASWQCPETMPVGIVAIGYADGYPRHAPTGTPVLVNGQKVPLIGRVSMDMLAVDLRSQPYAKVGDPVILWGKGLPVEEIASRAGTIPYQLLCNMNPRVNRIEKE